MQSLWPSGEWRRYSNEGPHLEKQKSLGVGGGEESSLDEDGDTIPHCMITFCHVYMRDKHKNIQQNSFL